MQKLTDSGRGGELYAAQNSEEKSGQKSPAVTKVSQLFGRRSNRDPSDPGQSPPLLYPLHHQEMKRDILKKEQQG